MIRLFISSLSATKLVILQGISGTGKHPLLMPGENSSNETLSLPLFNLHGETVPSYLDTSMSLPRNSMKQMS